MNLFCTNRNKKTKLICTGLMYTCGSFNEAYKTAGLDNDMIEFAYIRISVDTKYHR